MRSLLGEDAINSWELLEYQEKEWEEQQKSWWESLTNEEKQEYYNEHCVDAPISSETEEILEADANWKNFLESF